MRTQSETDEQDKVQARRDRDNYYLAMINGDTKTCLKIEQYYSLVGYAPELVTVGLNAAARDGTDPETAIETYIVNRMMGNN